MDAADQLGESDAARVAAKSRLDALQGLRAVAATMVVVDHAIMRVARWRGLEGTPFEHAGWHMGAIGVYVFFIISGFIMMYSFGDRFGAPGAPGLFAMKRIQRIVPIYWLATIPAGMLVFIWSRGEHPGLVDWLHAFLFVPTPVTEGQAMRPLLGQGWTLNYEMFFYVIFGVALFLRKGLGVIFVLGVLIALVTLGSLVKPLSDTRDAYDYVTFYTDPIMLLFGVGVVLATARRRWSSLRLRGALWLALAILAAAELGFVLARGRFPLNPLWLCALWLLCLIAVWLCIVDEGGEGRVRAWLSRLGDASYSTYLFHSFVIVVSAKVWERLPQSDLVFVIVSIVLANLAGLFCHRYIERGLDLVWKRSVAWLSRFGAALERSAS